MFVIRGIYDGEKFTPLEPFPNDKRYRVLITFLEEDNNEEKELRNFSSQDDGLEFWHDEREDLYQDYLPDKK
ncbi:MAG: hypothetical protein AAF740_12600 [Bacteroidota bacterium]